MDKITALNVRAERTLAQRLTVSRQAHFVGREAEQTYFAEFASAGCRQALWFIIGAGGVGKTALLQRLHEVALVQRAACIFIDARYVAPNPPAVRDSLARATGYRSLTAFCATARRALLLVDTFECWRDLEPWLHQEFLPEMPANLGVVVAGRQAPCAEWQADAGWRELMSVTRLGALSRDECQRYLGWRDIDAAQFERLEKFSSGHPLALAMAADALKHGNDPDLSSESRHSIYRTLLDNITREASHTRQQQVLDACAVASEVTEGLLARMLDSDDAHALFTWLSKLSFMERGVEGIFPHDLVREVLIATMDERAPGRYPTLARAAVNWVVDRMEGEPGLTGAQAAQIGAQAMYALRRVPMVQHYLSADGSRSLYVDRVTDDSDWAALADMTLRHEGPESCAWFEFWRTRFPGNVSVIRGIQGDPRAYILRLDMEALAPEDRAADPFTHRLWQAIENEFHPAPGERMAFHRFWINHDYAAHGSPEKTQIMMAITNFNLTTPNLRLTAQVFGTRTRSWPQQAAAIGLHLLDDSAITIGEHVYQIFYNDWLREPPMRYYRLFADRALGFEQTMSGLATPAQAYQPLSQEAFRDATVAALKNLHRPSELSRNPLLASALVLADAHRGGGETDRNVALVNHIKTAASALKQTGARRERLHRVLHHTYFVPARDQRQAAEVCHMGYSTYRRNLSQARAALIAELWRRERAHR